MWWREWGAREAYSYTVLGIDARCQVLVLVTRLLASWYPCHHGGLLVRQHLAYRILQPFQTYKASSNRRRVQSGKRCQQNAPTFWSVYIRWPSTPRGVIFNYLTAKVVHPGETSRESQGGPGWAGRWWVTGCYQHSHYSHAPGPPPGHGRRFPHPWLTMTSSPTLTPQEALLLSTYEKKI